MPSDKTAAGDCPQTAGRPRTADRGVRATLAQHGTRTTITTVVGLPLWACLLILLGFAAIYGIGALKSLSLIVIFGDRYDHRHEIGFA